MPIPDEEDFKNACETALDRFWKLGPRWGGLKFDKIKNFVNEDITLAQLSEHDDKINIVHIFTHYLTWIRMLVPNGYEFWYIANFEKGPRKSKWYRAVSTIKFEDCMLARLNVIGLKNSIISKLHDDHYPAKKSTKKEWYDFANELIRGSGHHLVDVEGLQSCEKEVSSLKAIGIHRTVSKVEITSCLQMKYFMDGEWNVKKCFYGKSARRVTKNQKSEDLLQKHKAKMKKEAEKAALEKCFRECLGFTEFKDIVCDELNRPITV